MKSMFSASPFQQGSFADSAPRALPGHGHLGRTPAVMVTNAGFAGAWGGGFFASQPGGAVLDAEPGAWGDLESLEERGRRSMGGGGGGLPFARTGAPRQVPLLGQAPLMGQPGTPPEPKPARDIRPSGLPETVKKNSEGEEKGKPGPGFHGKSTITFAEAKELSGLLEEALKPLTPAEEQSAEKEHACRREIKAGPYPIVVRLEERLKKFVETAHPMDMFEISKGELEVTQDAVECAIQIGRAGLKRTLTTAAAVTAGIGIPAAALLLFIL